jgi:signal peptidase II
VSSAPKKSPPAKDADAKDSTSGPIPRSRYIAYFAIALLGCGADLATKQAMFSWLGLPGHFVLPASVDRWRGDVNLPHRWWLIDNRLGVETSMNPGALFGLGQGYWWVFAWLSMVATIGILTWLFVYGAARDRWLTVALGSITGGILGNLYDRLGLWDTAGLRLADSLLVTGAIMLVVHAFVWREAKEPDNGGRKSEVGGRKSADKDARPESNAKIHAL